MAKISPLRCEMTGSGGMLLKGVRFSIIGKLSFLVMPTEEES
jgi:hypothetical protein